MPDSSYGLASIAFLLSPLLCFLLSLAGGGRRIRICCIVLFSAGSIAAFVLSGHAQGICSAVLVGPLLCFFADYLGGMFRGAWMGGDQEEA